MINNQEPVPTPPIPPITTFTIVGTITEDGTVKAGVPISFSSNSVYTTNGDGIYGAVVARNYVGSGTPVFSGGTFTPTSRVYATVISNYTDQNFVYNGTGGFGPQPLPEFVYVTGHAYSGQDVPQVPLNELPISINGTDAAYTTEDGSYLMQLPYGFTGTIYADDLFGTFSPANYVFYGLHSNQTGKDFLFYVTPPAPVGPFTISGTLFDYSDNFGYSVFYAGWQVDWNFGSTFSGADGRYSLAVPAGYTGTVAFFDVWGTSTPASYSLVNVQTNQPNKNFDIYGPDYITGGTLWNQTTNAADGFAPVEFTGYPTVFCNAGGVYAIDLPYSWIGNITAPYLGGGSSSPTAYAINGLAADDMSYNFQKYDPPAPALTVTRIGSWQNSSAEYAGTTVFVGASGQIETTTDGINFTPQVSGVIKSFRGIAVDGSGLFVACTIQGKCVTSPDGTNWTVQANHGAFPNWNATAVVHDGTKFWMSTDSGQIKSTADGVAWTLESTVAGGYVDDMIWDGTQFIATDGNQSDVYYTSPDGINWTTQATGVADNYRSICFGSSIYVMVGSGGVILYSADALNWTQAVTTSPSFASGFYQVAHGNGYFFLIESGTPGRIWYSTNGNNWVKWPEYSLDGMTSVFFYSGLAWLVSSADPLTPIVSPTISGTITDVSQGGILMPGVDVVFTSIGTYTTNSVGVYNVQLPELLTFNTIPTPVPEGFGAFTPVSYSYIEETTNQTNQNFSFSEYNACPVVSADIAPLSYAGGFVSPSRLVADDTQGLVWVIDESGPQVAYYDVTYGTFAGFVDSSPGGAFGVAGIVYDPVTNKVVIQDYNWNIQVINPVTKTVEVVLDGPREPSFHMLALGSSGTVYASSSRWVVPSPRAEIDVIDLNQTPAVVVARHGQTVYTDSICWATNISRLVVNSGGIGAPRFYLFNPVDGSFQVSTAVNPQNFNYENAYIKATGHLIQGFNSGAAVQVMDIANGTNAVVVHTLTGNSAPTRAADVVEDTCHARLFFSDGNYAIWEYTLDGNYTLINQFDDAQLGINPTGLAHSRRSNLVYYNNYVTSQLNSVHATTSGTLSWSFDSTDPDYAYSMAFNSGSFDVVLAGDQNGVQGSPGGFLQGANGFEFNGVLINLAPAYNSEVRVDYTSKIDDQGDLSFSTSTTNLQVMINGVYTYMPVTSQGTTSGSLVPTGVMNYGYNYIQIKGAAYTGGNLLSNPATVFSALNGTVLITAL